MRTGCLRISGWLFLLPVVLMALPTGRVQAQFGYGLGLHFQPQEVGLINSMSLLNASRATMGPVSNSPYAGNPNAYINRIYGNTLYSQYDVGTRRTLEASIGRFSDGRPPGRTPRPSPGEVATTQPSPGRATSPPPRAWALASYFDRYQKLEWPQGSPVSGTFQVLQAASNLATLAVLNEYNLRGLAQVSTVTDARSKLLDYGRPALEYVRNNSTARVADSFHQFLLSLYESLAQAATIPRANATPSPAQP